MSYKSKFKNANNVHHLKALFIETAIMSERDKVLYTLKSEDHELYPSIRRLYLECNDPSEYSFASKYLDNWSHFKKLSVCTWFKPILEELREELEMKVRSEALLEIRTVSSDNENKNHFAANRFLLAGGWSPKTDKRGRPSQESIRKEADKLFLAREDIDEDFTRLVSTVSSN